MLTVARITLCEKTLVAGTTTGNGRQTGWLAFGGGREKALPRQLSNRSSKLQVTRGVAGCELLSTGRRAWFFHPAAKRDRQIGAIRSWNRGVL